MLKLIKELLNAGGTVILYAVLIVICGLMFLAPWFLIALVFKVVLGL